MISDTHLIQPRHRGGHLVGLGFPQPRGALDVGQQQRHGARRQLAHAQLAPVSFAHASQHAIKRIAETSAKLLIVLRRLYLRRYPITRQVGTRSDGGTPTDGLPPAPRLKQAASLIAHGRLIHPGHA